MVSDWPDQVGSDPTRLDPGRIVLNSGQTKAGLGQTRSY